MAPTICEWMGFEVPENIKREWDGVSFIGKEGIYDLKSEKDGDKIKLSWDYFNPKEKLDIYISQNNNYKNGIEDNWSKVASVKADKGEYILDSKYSENDLIKINIRGKVSNANCWYKK